MGAEEQPIINRVAKSPLITIDLEDYYVSGERIEFDIKDLLFQGMILREKDFREFVREHDWSQYQDKNVAIFCSADAIVPTWAYMLLAAKLEPFANHLVFGNLQDLGKSLCLKAVEKTNFNEYENAKVVIKGCSKIEVPEFAFVELTRRLRPVVNSIMYGEPCSTVPIYKKPKN